MSFYFMEHVPTGMKANGSSEEIFECPTDRWKHSALFMDDLTRRVPRSSCFVLSVTKFIGKNMKDIGDEIEQ